jgi:hypothetical protein
MALKKLDSKNNEEGFPITSLREIMILRRLENNNVIKLHEVFLETKNNIETKTKEYHTFLVFDYMHHDFIGLL